MATRSLETETLATLWQTLSPYGHVCLLEVADLPSLNYCLTSTTVSPPFEVHTVDGWVDVVVANRPKRNDSRVPVALSAKRRGWWTKRIKAGGAVYVMLRLRPAGAGRPLFALFEGAEALDRLDNASVEGMQAAALATWEDVLPSDNTLARWLVS